MELPAFLEGRQGRLAYATQLLVIFLPLLVAYPPSHTSNWALLLLATLLIIVCTGTAALLAVRRFHDIGLSGWYTLLLIIPGLNLPGLLLLALLPGAPVLNRWGAAAPARISKSRFSLNGYYFTVLRYLRTGLIRTVAH
ncbi:DUF805 domain-containing protein [Hymenobacter sp. BT186]|uniref:DUF805 domain-containing protein n=2 Tax=Hymenobacter telluris TaxID=2816474 RepID=A0A939EZU3_9BACT|nr:DUF805 domain-containing protein [Hymenobacter telluris]MBW3376208.1 DUF805 domain-containing protein [Hymenobacter norwichensis]